MTLHHVNPVLDAISPPRLFRLISSHLRLRILSFGGECLRHGDHPKPVQLLAQALSNSLEKDAAGRQIHRQSDLQPPLHINERPVPARKGALSRIPKDAVAGGGRQMRSQSKLPGSRLD